MVVELLREEVVVVELLSVEQILLVLLGASNFYLLFSISLLVIVSPVWCSVVL